MDKALRKAERDGNQSALLKARLRAGELEHWRVDLAAMCGHPAARELMPVPPDGLCGFHFRDPTKFLNLKSFIETDWSPIDRQHLSAVWFPGLLTIPQGDREWEVGGCMNCRGKGRRIVLAYECRCSDPEMGESCEACRSWDEDVNGPRELWERCARCSGLGRTTITVPFAQQVALRAATAAARRAYGPWLSSRGCLHETPRDLYPEEGLTLQTIENVERWADEPSEANRARLGVGCVGGGIPTWIWATVVWILDPESLAARGGAAESLRHASNFIGEQYIREAVSAALIAWALESPNPLARSLI